MEHDHGDIAQLRFPASLQGAVVFPRNSLREFIIVGVINKPVLTDWMTVLKN